MRSQIIELIRLGPLPPSRSARIDEVKRYQDLLLSIVHPVTDAEACALVRLFGPDDCFGLAWTLIHLVETAPSWPIGDCLLHSDNSWLQTLRERAERGQRLGDSGVKGIIDGTS